MKLKVSLRTVTIFLQCFQSTILLKRDQYWSPFNGVRSQDEGSLHVLLLGHRGENWNGETRECWDTCTYHSVLEPRLPPCVVDTLPLRPFSTGSKLVSLTGTSISFSSDVGNTNIFISGLVLTLSPWRLKIRRKMRPGPSLYPLIHLRGCYMVYRTSPPGLFLCNGGKKGLTPIKDRFGLSGFNLIFFSRPP